MPSCRFVTHRPAGRNGASPVAFKFGRFQASIPTQRSRSEPILCCSCHPRCKILYRRGEWTHCALSLGGRRGESTFPVFRGSEAFNLRAMCLPRGRPPPPHPLITSRPLFCHGVMFPLQWFSTISSMVLSSIAVFTCIGEYSFLPHWTRAFFPGARRREQYELLRAELGSLRDNYEAFLGAFEELADNMAGLDRSRSDQV